ncbi:MAG: hypothetical protein HN929_11470 [Chloroflexi bacterium]|jgi:hypothetical protein|nr:hypothetical protein [Chloroflexota bacterium]
MGGSGKSTPSVPAAPAAARMPFTPEAERKAGSKRATSTGKQSLQNKSGLSGTILTNPLGALGQAFQKMLGQ